MKEILQSYTLTQIKQLMQVLHQPSFRAKQMYTWCMNYTPIREMSNLPLALREQLEQSYTSTPVTILKEYTSKDGTQKFLLQLQDHQLIECVLMHYTYGNTLCISSQVGCRMGCEFCASGKNGWFRNLTSGEMLGEVLCVNQHIGGTMQNRKITNIVLMGSGEPLDNYENTIAFIRQVSAPEGICISQRNISLSTCGLVPEIEKLAQENLDITLTISLHAATDAKRSAIMPIARKYSIAELITAVRNYQNITKRRVVFEYVLTTTNGTHADVQALKNLCKGLLCHINIIPLNQGVSAQTTVSRTRAEAFCKKLEEAGLSATVRRTLGADIEGACGQLKRRYLENQSNS